MPCYHGTSSACRAITAQRYFVVERPAMHCNPFAPGDESQISIPECLRGSPRPIPAASLLEPRSFEVYIPARLGLSVKDMATFGPGKAGGGGIGFAANLFNSTCAAVRFADAAGAAQDIICDVKRAPVIRHQVAVFRRALREAGCGDVHFSASLLHHDAFPAHSGLGSTSGAALGALHGLNLALDSPFSRDEIRRLLACNYVEEDQHDPELVAFGYETTMTAVGADLGGFYVIDEHTLNVSAHNAEAFQGCAVYIFTPAASPSPSNDALPAPEVSEVAVLTEGAATDVTADVSSMKAKVFENILIPELGRGAACNIQATTLP